MQLIGLACPACDVALTPASERRVFVCESCGVSSTVGPAPADGVSEPPLWQLPRTVARPRLPIPDDGPLVLLPLWVIPIRSEELGVWAERMPREIRLPALGVGAMSTLLKHGQNLTRAPGALEELEFGQSGVPRLRPSSAELTVEDAYSTAEIIALAHVEGWPPDPQMDRLEIPLDAARMVDLPCHQRTGSLTDLVFGLAVADSLLRHGALVDQRDALREGLSHASR